MCKKVNYAKTSNVRIDKCMINLIRVLKFKANIKVLACCCGHLKYPQTIIYQNKTYGTVAELNSGIIISRKRNFYKRDKQGYYYIPEVLNNA